MRKTIVDHAAGNYRILVRVSADLLMTAAQREITILDEKLYLQVFGRPNVGAPPLADASAQQDPSTAPFSPRSLMQYVYH